MQEFSDREKAAMLEHIIDEIITAYTNKKPIKDFKSRAEMVGFTILTQLNNSGFITNENILGK